MLLGIHLTLMIGPTIAVPAPALLTEALSGVEVTHNDQGRSGFQLTFQVGRSGPLDLLDYPLLANPLLKPFNRVVLVVRFNLMPKVLMDGIITNQQLAPSNEPGASTLTVTGEDISVMMDMEEKTAEYPAQNEAVIATRLIMSYPQYGMIPIVIPPVAVDFPAPTQRIPVQNGTDLQYLQTLAARYSYVFYVKPGLVPMQNVAYWGPPERMGIPQKAISVNMGPDTNVESINFQHNALSPTLVTGTIFDADLNLPLPVITTPISTRIPLASQPALLINQPNVRRRLLNRPGESVETVSGNNSISPHAEAPVGLNFTQALARAQAMVDASTDNVVTATGELDALRYGDLLQARGLVGLRGAGFNYDGIYYVKSVTHSIRKGEYKQRFTLRREGTGSLTPLVRP